MKTSDGEQALPESAESDSVRDESVRIQPAAFTGAADQADTPEQVAAATIQPMRDQQLEAAHAELKAGRSDSAAELFQRVLDRTPNHPRAHHGLAVIADADGRYADAERHYQRTLEQLPHDPNVLNDLGYSYLLQNRLTEAESYLQQATRIQPMHDLAHVNLARLAYRRGQADVARRMLDERFGNEQAEKMMTSLDEWASGLAGGQVVVGTPQPPRYNGSGTIMYSTGTPTPGRIDGAGSNVATHSNSTLEPEIPVMPTIRQRATAPNSSTARITPSPGSASGSAPGLMATAVPPRDASWDQVMMAAQAEAARARQARSERQAAGAMLTPDAQQTPAGMTMAAHGAAYPGIPQQPSRQPQSVPQQNGLPGQYPAMVQQQGAVHQGAMMMQPASNDATGQQPMAQQPMMQQPMMQQPMMQQPMMQQPMMQQPVVQGPAMQPTMIPQPVMQQPVVQQPNLQAPVMVTPNSPQMVAGLAPATAAMSAQTRPNTEFPNSSAMNSRSGVPVAVSPTQPTTAMSPAGIPMGNVIDSSSMEANSSGRQFPIYGPGLNDPNAAAGRGVSNVRTSTFGQDPQATNTGTAPGVTRSVPSPAATQTQIAGLNAGPGGLFPIGYNAGQAPMTQQPTQPARLAAAPPMMSVPHENPGSMTNINGAMYQPPSSRVAGQTAMNSPNVTGVATQSPTIPPIRMPAPQEMMLSNMQGNPAVIPAAGVGNREGLQPVAGTMPINGSRGIATAVYPGQTPAAPTPNPAPGSSTNAAADSAAFEALLNQLRSGQ